eukprot:4113901-Pleurochrysis_carterae.AAC.2
MTEFLQINLRIVLVHLRHTKSLHQRINARIPQAATATYSNEWVDECELHGYDYDSCLGRLLEPSEAKWQV